MAVSSRARPGIVKVNRLEPGRTASSPLVRHTPCRYFTSSPEVIRLAGMMSVRDPFSLRQGEDRLCERGLDIGHETVRDWWNRVGPVLAAEIRKRRGHHRSYSLWRGPLDEVLVRINGTTHELWRAVDHDGDVGEGVVTNRRDRRAARECLTRAMTRDGRPASIVTDRLPSSRAAMKVIGNEGGQETRRWRNNRAEHAQQPFRRRAGAMARVRDIKTLQKCTAVQASIHNHVNHQRHLNRRGMFKHGRAAARAEWRQRAV